MPNVFDYLAWRGDLTFAQSPFNEADSLILCRLAYIPFDGIAPASFVQAIPLADAAARCLHGAPPQSAIPQTGSAPRRARYQQRKVCIMARCGNSIQAASRQRAARPDVGTGCCGQNTRLTRQVSRTVTNVISQSRPSASAEK